MFRCIINRWYICKWIIYRILIQSICYCVILFSLIMYLVLQSINILVFTIVHVFTISFFQMNIITPTIISKSATMIASVGGYTYYDDYHYQTVNCTDLRLFGLHHKLFYFTFEWNNTWFNYSEQLKIYSPMPHSSECLICCRSM